MATEKSKAKSSSKAKPPRKPTAKREEPKERPSGASRSDRAQAGASSSKTKKPSAKATTDKKTAGAKAKARSPRSGSADGHAARNGAHSNGHKPNGSTKAKGSRATKAADEPRMSKEEARESVDTLLRAIESFVDEYHLGHVVRDGQFDWGEVENQGLRPALAFVSFERWAEYRHVPTNLTWHVVPDMVVEIQLEARQSNALREKIRDYFDAGVRRVWVVVPSRRELHDYESSDKSRVIERERVLRGEGFLPEFRRALGLSETHSA
jgi:Uma2 family endonuclease